MGNSSSSDGTGAVPSQPGFTPVTTKRPGSVRVSRLGSSRDQSAQAPLAPPLSPTAESSIVPEGGPTISPPGSFKEEAKQTGAESRTAASSASGMGEVKTPTAKTGSRQQAQAQGQGQGQGQVYGAAYPPEMIEAMMQKEALRAGKTASWKRVGDATGGGGGEGELAVVKEQSGGGGGGGKEIGVGDEDRDPGRGGGGEEKGKEGDFSASKAHRNRERFEKLLDEPVTDLNGLRALCWSGCTTEHRPDTWRLLLRYMPGNRTRRLEKMSQLRHEYADAVTNYFEKYNADTASEYDRTMYNQIAVDLPRTNPSMLLFQSPIVQASLHRILFVWGIRHPGTGYVQGINDLVTPFFYVFLREATGADDASLASGEVLERAGAEALQRVEADCYHCLTSMLDNAQDNYVVDFKGIQEKIFRLKRIIARLDDKLVHHLESENVDFIQFAFRWFNCLLMREFSMACTLRLWDSYVSDKQFAAFHVYVCAAVLLSFSADLKAMDFQEIIMFLQKLPTHDWTAERMDVILAQAYAWAEQFSVSHM